MSRAQHISTPKAVFHSLPSAFIRAFSFNLWLIVTWIRDVAFALSFPLIVKDISQGPKTQRWPLIVGTIQAEQSLFLQMMILQLPLSFTNFTLFDSRYTLILCSAMASEIKDFVFEQL